MTLPNMREGLVSREFLRIAGGYGVAAVGTSPAGGVDIDNAGNLATDGDVTIKGIISAGSTPQDITNVNGEIDGSKIQNATVDTAHLADDAVTAAKLDETDSYTLAGLIATGRTHRFSNFHTEYRWEFGGADDLNWKNIADITIGTGLWAGACFQIDFTDANSNYGHVSDAIPLRYYVSAVRSGAAQDDADNGSVSGPIADYVRLVKTALGMYELQVRQTILWVDLLVTARVITANGLVTVSYIDSPADGSLGTIYTAAATHTLNVPNLKALGDAKFDGGDVDAGTDGANRGVYTAWDGAGGNAPGCVKLCSPNGTAWYVFVEDDGTLKVHSALPTANTDGSVVGAQT